MSDVAGELRSMVGVHPLKDEFKRLGVRQVEVAAFLGVSVSSVAHLLCGYRRPSAAVESRLQALAARVRREREAQSQVVAEHE